MKSFDHLTDSVLLKSYFKALEKNLDPVFIQLLLAEISKRGLEVEVLEI